MTTKCSKCGVILTEDNHYKGDNYCKECRKSYQRERYNQVLNALRVVPSDSVCGGGEDRPLSKFTPRQLIEELRKRGYKGTLKYEYEIKL